jgi:two-component system sensor histidine kinase/response regulator
MMRQATARADILIVDDIAENLEFLSAELSAHRYDTRPVTSGELALMAARASPPDLVLLDILMPSMDGYEVCQAFKMDAQISDIPIIFISGLNETIDKVRAFQVGAVDYISKPFQFEEVLARIETHLTLYRQRRELEQQRDLKARFLSMASHEFRNPLAIIRANVETLIHYIDQISADKRIEKLRKIDREVMELNQLVSEVLLFNKMELTRLEFRPEEIDVKAFCGKIVDRFLELSDAQSMIYLVEDDVTLAFIDAYLLNHVLSNLLSNALKYSPSGKHVYLHVTQDIDYLIFKVIDQGVGIPLNEQKYIFSQFYRATNAASFEGTGLGLAIVKQYVTRHGGSVHFESAENVGTTFTVQIPRHKITV